MHLPKLKPEDWNKLFNLIPEIEATNKIVEWIIENKSEDGVYPPPHYPWVDVECKFSEIVYELGIITDFDWWDWDEGRKIGKNKQQNYNQLDVIFLCKLITAIIRNDRFCEGVLKGSFEDGTMLKIIKVLQQKTLG